MDELSNYQKNSCDQSYYWIFAEISFYRVGLLPIEHCFKVSSIGCQSYSDGGKKEPAFLSIVYFHPENKVIPDSNEDRGRCVCGDGDGKGKIK